LKLLHSVNSGKKLHLFIYGPAALLIDGRDGPELCDTPYILSNAA